MIFRYNYIPGGYKRGELRGYIQYRRYKYKTLYVDTIKGRNIFRDSFIDRLYEMGLLKESLYFSYYDKLKNMFKDFEIFDHLTDEQLYYAVYILKKDLFDIKIEKYLRDKRKNDLERIMSGVNNFKTPNDLIMEMIFYNVKKDKREQNSPINGIDRLLNDFEVSDEIIFIVGNYKQLPLLLAFCERYLKSKKIEILFKNNPVDDEPGYDDIDFFEKHAKNSHYKFHVYSSTSYGIDLTDKSLRWILPDENTRSKLVVGLDENMMMTLDGAIFNYHILSKVENIKAQRYTNIYMNSSKKIPFVIAYVKGGDVISDRYYGVERTIGSLYHYHIKGYKNHYMNFYSNTYDPEKFTEFDIEHSSFSQIILDRDENISKVIRRFLSKVDATYIDSYHHLDNLSKIEYIPEQSQNATLVRGVYFKDTSKVNITPALAQDFNSDLLYVRDMLKDGLLKENGLYFNFLYFATRNIVRWYNALRNENERLNFNNFFIGYIHKGDFTTFPLYNKAYIKCSKMGEISIQRKKLGAGSLTINGLTFDWKDEDVNSTDKRKDIIIFTPYMSNEKLSTKETDFTHFTMDIGQKRYNIVLVNNRIVSVRRGTVKQPSLGVVVSLNGKSFSEFAKAVNLSEIMDGYFKVDDDYELHVDLKGDKDCLWAFGGGSLLVKNGENLVENSRKAFDSFAKEGWFHPLSMQTQETQVQEWVRGPRTLVGTTEEGGFFVFTFSGRTKESKGIRFDEAVEILKNEIGNLKDVMNLDGGASSCLGLIYKNEFFELSYPCTSDDTSAGLVRPVNSAVFVTKKA